MKRRRRRRRKKRRRRRAHRDSHLAEDPLWDRSLDSLLQLLSTRAHQLHGDEHVSLQTGSMGNGVFTEHKLYNINNTLQNINYK